MSRAGYCRRWSGRACRLRLLHEREAGVKADLVIEQEAAAGERGVPVDAMVDAVDDALELEADALVAPRIGVRAGDRGVQRDRLGDALQGQLALDAVGSDQRSAERRLRIALDVEELGRLDVAVAVLVVGVRAAGADGAG